MSYRNSIINKHYTNQADFRADLFGEMEAAGWTLEDNQDGSSYRVYSSNGKNGDRIKEFMRINWDSSKIYFQAYYYWDSTNHSGYGHTYHKAYVTTSDDFYGWLYGNKNLFAVMINRGGTHETAFFGHFPKRFWETPLSKLTADVGAGDNVILTLDNTTDFIEGKAYQIVGASGEGRDRITVQSITDSTHLVVSHLPRNYGTNSLFGAVPSIFGNSNQANVGLYRFCITCNYQANGTENSSYTLQINYPFLERSYVDPDYRKNFYVLQPITLLENNNVSIVGYSDEYFLVPPTGSPEDVFYVGKQDNGTSSGSNDTNTLNDTTKNWGTNSFTNKVIIITNGPGVGEVHKIASNTATQITIADNWITVPDETSSYVIADKAYRYLYQYLAAREGV